MSVIKAENGKQYGKSLRLLQFVLMELLFTENLLQESFPKCPLKTSWESQTHFVIYIIVLLSTIEK